MSYQIIADFPCGTGEGPLYHPDRRQLYWTDIPAGRLYRYDPATGEAMCFYEDRSVGGYTIQADGSLLLFRDRGNIVTLDPDTGAVIDTVIDELPDEVGTRFNDVIADPAGRVFCGTMPVPEGQPTGPRKGRLYRLNTDGSIHLLLEGIGCSNGMAFILDDAGHATGMYYIDTPTGNVYRFDYDQATGAITNQQVFIHIEKGSGLGGPDGMTVDDRGHLYIALWGGWGVAQYDAQGRFVTKHELPAKCVTCPIFAPTPTPAPGSTPGNAPAPGSVAGSAPASGARKTGDAKPGASLALDRLYVTSGMGQKRPAFGEHAGATFVIDVGARGRTEHRSRVGG